MKLLLDTHIAVWAISQSNKLTDRTKTLLLSPENEIYFSVISLWEVSLKHSIDPEDMEITASEFRTLCLESGFHEISLDYQHILGLDQLIQKEGTREHKDPFDRLLLSQAITEKMHFITHDHRIPTFDFKNIIPV